MTRLRLLPLLLGLAAFVLPVASLRSQVSISHVEVTNVTTSSAMLVWKVSSVSVPGIDVFADALGTVSLNGQFEVEFFPVFRGDPLFENSFDARNARIALQEDIREREVVLVRLTGLAPNSTYYVRPRTYAVGGADNGASVVPLVPIQTAASTAFVRNARLLELDFSDAGDAAGLVVVLEGPAGTGALSAVVGEGTEPQKAVFNLSDLLDLALRTNAAPTGETVFSAKVYDLDAAPLEPQEFAVIFGVDTVVAAADRSTYSITPPEAFVVDTVPDQVTGLAFTITIRALAQGGVQLSNYSGRVSVSGVDFGSGTTAAFTGGMLRHSVKIDSVGPRTITVERNGLSAVSNQFLVMDTFGSWKARNFSAPDRANAAISGVNADPGGHGVPNVLRYAFNTGVNPPSHTRMPYYGAVQHLGSNYLSITFPRSPAADDVRYVVQASGNMSSWTDVETVLPGTPEWVTVRDPVAMGAGTPRFLRVKVIQESTFSDYASDLLSDTLKQDPTATQPNEDYQGRGIPNLLRYAFGMNFLNPSPAEMPVVSSVSGPGGTRLSVTFKRIPSAGNNLRYVVQSGALMQPWVTVQTVYPGVPEWVTVEDTVAPNGTPRFMRVLVLQD